MFWQSHAAASGSVDQLLDKQDVTLEQLLDDDDIIQECKAQNSKVVDFLIRQEVLTSLVERLVSEPPAGADLTVQFRHPSLACEVVQCAIPAVLDRLVADRALLERLCALLRQPAPLNPLLASFLSRTLSILLVKRTDQMLEFLRSQEQFISQVLQHLGTSAVMDLLCHLVAGMEEPETRQETLRWLSQQRLVERLTLLVGDAEQPERQANAAHVLVAVISSGRQMALLQQDDEPENNPLLDTIETEAFVSSLVDAVLPAGRTEVGLVSAVHVLLPLLDASFAVGGLAAAEAAAAAAAAGQREPASVAVTAAALLARLAALHQALVSPPPRPDLTTSWGRLSPPLGATRLQLARLTAALLATGRPTVSAQLASLGTIDVLLDLFFHFTLNNFLHSQVEQCVSLILESAPQETGEAGSSSHPLLEQLFTSSKLIQRILHGMEERDTTIDECDQNRCWRSLRGYGGHLASIANKVVAALESGPNCERLRQLIDQLPEDVSAAWRTFCDAQLRRINELNRPAVMPDTRHDSSNDSDFRGVDSHEAALLKMTSEGLSDAFGRVDDDFRHHLSSGTGPLGAAGLLSLAADAEARPGAAEMFEQQCADRLGGGGGGGGGWPSHAATSSSSDEEDDDDDESRMRMEVDMSDPWAAPPAAAMDTNVWQSAPAADLSADRHWANFDAFAAPAGRTPSPPLLPAPAAALGVSADSQTSFGVAPPRPPGSASPHFPVDFSTAAAFASSPEPAPMVSSPPHPEPSEEPSLEPRPEPSSGPSPVPSSEPSSEPSRPAEPTPATSDRLAADQSGTSDGAATAVPCEPSPAASTTSAGMDASPAAADSTSSPPPPPSAGSESEHRDAD